LTEIAKKSRKTVLKLSFPRRMGQYFFIRDFKEILDIFDLASYLFAFFTFSRGDFIQEIKAFNN